MSEWVRLHHECEKCGSSDGASTNDRGWTTCFPCGETWKSDPSIADSAEDEDDDEEVNEKPRRGHAASSDIRLKSGRYVALPKRSITKESCSKFGYKVSQDNLLHIAEYRNKQGAVIAQHMRSRSKEFYWAGDQKGALLFGQHLWTAAGKTAVTVTEGELDALSVSQVQGHQWPVVSIKSGANAAKKDFAQQINWLSSFHKVVILFDDDEPGRQAAEECARVLPIGKAYIGRIDGFKDANEALMAGKEKVILDAIFRAKQWRPQGIVDIAELKERAMAVPEQGLPWWDERLSQATFGRRRGEMYGLGAGSGVGKSDWIMQSAAYDVDVLGQNVGLMFLEQGIVESAQRMAGKIDGVPYHLPNQEGAREAMGPTFDRLAGKVKLYDSWGDSSWEPVEQFIRFIHATEGTYIFYLDHLTAMADPEKERETLEKLMKGLARLVNELKLILLFVSHLSTPEGKPHEEGGRVMAKHFKGSRSIAFWSFFMFGIERNTQAEDPATRNLATFRVLKDRTTGQATGKTFFLTYDPTTTRLVPSDGPSEVDPEDF
jgi:twinkle protein